MTVLTYGVEERLDAVEVLKLLLDDVVTGHETLAGLARGGHIFHVTEVHHHIIVNGSPQRISLTEQVGKLVRSVLADGIVALLKIVDDVVALADYRVEVIPISLLVLKVYIEVRLVIRLQIELRSSDKAGDVAH